MLWLWNKQTRKKTRKKNPYTNHKQEFSTNGSIYKKRERKLSTKYRVYIGSGNVYFHSIYKKTYRTGITKQDPKNYCSDDDDDDDDYIEKLTFPSCYYCKITKKKRSVVVWNHAWISLKILVFFFAFRI